MTEDKKHNLLRKDLCPRFPYYVKLKVKYEDDPWTLFVMHQSENVYVLGAGGYPIEVKLTDCQPYIRPLSSMTPEEKKYIKYKWGYSDWDTLNDFINYTLIDTCDAESFIDWLNANYFDYRGLIEKGIAIDATGLNIY